MRTTKYNALFFLLTAMAAVLSLDSCVKSRGGETDFGGLKPIVQIPEGGLANFGTSALTFPGSDPVDTAWFHLNFAATNVASKDVTITIGYDANAMAAVNAGLDPSSQYTKFPDSTYKFTSTSVTVKAGQSYSAAVPFIVYPAKIDPTKSYMFPITISNASGYTVSGNFGTLYIHVIGNPIAGGYTWDFTRWNSLDTTTAKSGASFKGGSAVFSPDDPLTIEVPSGYFIQPRYVLSFTNNGGVLSNFQLSMNPSDVAALTAGGVTIVDGPTIWTADPVNHVYKFHYSVFNGSAYRYLIDKYYR